MEQKKESKPKAGVRVLLCVLVLAGGLVGMLGLKSMKKPPKQAQYEEPAIKVETVTARPEDVQVHIQGFGEVGPLNTVRIAPEVSGRIVAIHPRLETGEIVQQGDTLFKIDPVNYQAAYSQAKANVAQWKNTIARLKKELSLDRQRLETLKRNRDLAKAEFERLRRLYQNDKVGTRSGVDQAEQAYNSARDRVDQMAQKVAIYPIQIQENQSALASARAALKTAKANLDRCEVKAPFTGRVKSVALEAGQYVSPGVNVVTLADDSVLEIPVPLDSRDVKAWLRFDPDRKNSDMAWFSGLKPVPVAIRWTEDQEGHVWTGHLHRAVEFDSQTRTLTVAIRVQAKDAVSQGNLPLVEGMFCAVAIPGKTLENVIRLPRWAVSFENTVYVARENRLNTVPVEIARTQGEQSLISSGIAAGDQVIVTRLADPLENALLEIVDPKGDETEEAS